VAKFNSSTDGGIAYSRECKGVSFADGGRYLRLAFVRNPSQDDERHEDVERWVRGKCKGFSFGSRRRMLDRLNSVSVAAELPDFITLTLPDGAFDDDVERFAKTAKAHLDTLAKRIRRACPSACGFWRIEWKARKSGKHEGKLFPHFHMLAWGFPQRLVGETFDGVEINESFVPVRDQQQSFTSIIQDVRKKYVFKGKTPSKAVRSCEAFQARADRHLVRSRFTASESVESYMNLFDWISLAWYHVVGTGNVEHFLAGCRVEKIRTWGGVLSYCAKYMSKADAENFLVDVPTGRSWGVFNRAYVPWAKMIELPLDIETGIRVRRIARRYLEHKLGRRVQRHYGMTVYCDVAQWKRLLARPPDVPF
jgi:hypothetical protein